MKTLSVRQPWAWLICQGMKTVENRTWRTSYRGRLAIHASLTVEKYAIDNLVAEIKRLGEAPITEEEIADMHNRGVIIGTVDLVDCTREPADEYDREWHDAGTWAWILRNPVMLERPRIAKGKLGLWESDL